MGIDAFLLAAAVVTASSSPAPTPTPKPWIDNLTWSGSARAYYFVRSNGNTCLTHGCNPTGTPDAQAFSSGLRLQGEFAIPRTAFSLGATYFGAEPFGTNAPGVLGVGYNPQVDNTLPGYGLSTLGEMYAQYKTPGVFFQTGKEEINTPWANAADSRIVPVLFQGTLLTANVAPGLKLGTMYMARYKTRITSAFNANTLFTSCDTAYPTGKGPIAGIPGTFTVPGDQCYTQQTTKGFLEFSATYDANGLSANAYQYHMYDLVNLTYFDAKYAYARHSPVDPFVAAQYWTDNDNGRSLVGTVHSHGFGLEFGQNVARNVQLALSFDQQAQATFVVPSAACDGTVGSTTKPEQGKIFGGVPDDTARGLPAGDVLCYAGGTASPYTDNYESDPLFTSSIGEGLTDSRKPGFALKAAVTAQTVNRRLKALLSQARYNVSLPGTSGGQPNTDIRIETNIDVQYFFNPVPASQPYHGLSLRERLVDRVTNLTPYDFKYIRTQLEFDF